MREAYNKVLAETEVLHTPRLTLRNFKDSDYADVLEFGSDERALQYLTWSGVANAEEAQQAITEYYLSRPGIYAVVLTENQKCIGCFDLRLEPEHEKAGFGYVLNRQYWNKGYMTEALNAVLSFCFAELTLNRVESMHYMGNAGSGRVMEKCGMRQEGVAPEEVKIKGKFHDVVHYGITKKQWCKIET